ncbi:hypothetical protein JRO89_XS03G0328600 [Xanthoceras sorbifolium]|uniref:Uncharacterized protein n=1 Tax=Xanthoceras sorbifolium TaxID=99658 RepID=A0ABQ8ID97_9ROSI|nr:hypothetical protein JRO89_XS03G0328600 [Xanthoceras sorbifolium]
MPFLLSFILFVNGAVWTVYAVFTTDLFIGIPNGTGFVLGTAQLVIYAMYWKPKSSSSTTSKETTYNLEDGWQHQPLILTNNSTPLLQKREA